MRTITSAFAAVLVVVALTGCQSAALQPEPELEPVEQVHAQPEYPGVFMPAPVFVPATPKPVAVAPVEVLEPAPIPAAEPAAATVAETTVAPQVAPAPAPAPAPVEQPAPAPAPEPVAPPAPQPEPVYVHEDEFGPDPAQTCADGRSECPTGEVQEVPAS